MLDEEIPSVFARGADLLELLAHELPFTVADALGEGTLDVNGKSLWTLDS